MSRKKDERSIRELQEAWSETLSVSSRREVVRHLRVAGRETGDWHGPDDIEEAFKLAAKMLDMMIVSGGK